MNGAPSGEFAFGRGICQGDPLSPFLFLIAAEGLNLLIKRAVRANLLAAAKVGKDEVEVSHIQYADDSVFVVDGTLENVAVIKRLLRCFELLSGLSVNFEKSCVYGVNMDAENLEVAAGVLGCKIGSFPIPYLGMKVGGRLYGSMAWSYVLEKMKKKLKGWDVKSLSMGGRVTLIQSTLSAIPLYWLSFLPLPKSVENKIRSLQCTFLWGVSPVLERWLG